MTPNDKAHCSIVDTSLHEYPSVVGDPIFIIFTQQDIAAPLSLITSYRISSNARISLELECCISDDSVSWLHSLLTTPYLPYIKFFLVPNIRKIFTGPLGATVTLIRRQQLCHNNG